MPTSACLPSHRPSPDGRRRLGATERRPQSSPAARPSRDPRLLWAPHHLAKELPHDASANDRAPIGRSAAAGSAAAPTWQVAIVLIAEGVMGLVATVESQPTAGPAVRAFQSAIRRRGQEAAEAGGTEAME